MTKKKDKIQVAQGMGGVGVLLIVAALLINFGVAGPASAISNNGAVIKCPILTTSTGYNVPLCSGIADGNGVNTFLYDPISNCKTVFAGSDFQIYGIDINGNKVIVPLSSTDIANGKDLCAKTPSGIYGFDFTIDGTIQDQLRDATGGTRNRVTYGMSGTLNTQIAPQCGDATCQSTETCSSCPSDCGKCPPPEPKINGMALALGIIGISLMLSSGLIYYKAK